MPEMRFDRELVGGIVDERRLTVIPVTFRFSAGSGLPTVPETTDDRRTLGGLHRVALTSSPGTMTEGSDLLAS
jgi:hypothetical protein